MSLIGSVMGGGPSLARRWHAALEKSVAAHFKDNHVINCMCHSTENIYRYSGGGRGQGEGQERVKIRAACPTQ